MAFDMTSQNQREKIDHHEESIFTYVTESPDFPFLSKLWKDFYSDPRISPNESNAIVHELIALRQKIQNDKQATFVVDRLLPFFSKAYNDNQEIRCISD